ncbi:MAG: glycosyltransferase [Thermoleophilaceae bacterium]
MAVAATAAVLGDIADVTVITTSRYEDDYRRRAARGDAPLDNCEVLFVEEPDPADVGSYYGFMHLYSARVLERLRERYGARGPDLIEFPDFLGEGLVTVQARRARERFLRDSRVCVRIHTSSEICSVLNGYVDDTFDTKVLFAGERHALRFADRVITPGGDNLGTYVRFYGRDGVAPGAHVPGIVPRFDRRPESPPPVDAGLRLLYIGRLERRKGVHDLVRAATGLRAEGWSLTLLGGDTDTAPLGLSLREQLELAAGGDERIRLVGELGREEVAATIADHHVVVVPSRWECWPSVLIEALAMNRPVLATPTGGMVEMLADPGGGWLTDGCGARALAAGLEGVLEDSGRVEELIETGSPARVYRDLVDESRFRDAYGELIGASPEPVAAERNRGVRPGSRRPLVSIVIPFFALDRFVEATIRSAFAQDHSPLEVIVVNDGSMRPEDVVLKELATRYPIQVVTQHNSGLGRARNTGIRVSRGSYLLPLDADNMIVPEFVSRCLDVLESEPDVAFVTTWSRYIDEREQPLSGLGGGYQPIGNTTEMVRENNLAGDATALIRRRVFDLGHWYSGDLTSYEDWHFYWQLHDAGLHGRVIPERLLLYRVRRDSMIREVGMPHHDRLYGEMRALSLERQMEWVCRNDSAWRPSTRTR